MNTKQCDSCIFEGRRECIYHGYPEETISPSCPHKIGILATIDPIEAQLHNKAHDAAIKAAAIAEHEGKHIISTPEPPACFGNKYTGDENELEIICCGSCNFKNNCPSGNTDVTNNE